MKKLYNVKNVKYEKIIQCKKCEIRKNYTM